VFRIVVLFWRSGKPSYRVRAEEQLSAFNSG
jgi:hypothetical protein